DSSVVLCLALQELGPNNVLAVTAHGDVHVAEELQSAKELAALLGARHQVISTRELEIPGFAANPPERCYLCRSALYDKLLVLAADHSLAAVVDGVTADDSQDYRPGLRAGRERGVRSPLLEAGLRKQEIRSLAQRLGLPNWNRPASPCLASRFPYGERLTRRNLERVAAGERELRSLGFSVVRMRHHGPLVRVEVSADKVSAAATPPLREAIVRLMRGLGYQYVTLDLEGFRSGSMNEVLQAQTTAEGEA
ncbi:MAG: ATP-dependent sacrificial sulfur transferase LarE, partial [Thermoleophilia bacterium]|nr:ATP-dependent sacrificial sulfur transferase LarE [Thermoleophilia bacterium]